MIGPAVVAPYVFDGWKGTRTHTATCGCVEGANPIIQSWMFAVGFERPVCAVPVFTAASSDGGKIP
jgi:hypothetical protein